MFEPPTPNPDALLTATEASRSTLAVSRDVIYQWAHRDLIAPKGRRGRQPLYRWDDLVAVERKTRASPQSSRH